MTAMAILVKDLSTFIIYARSHCETAEYEPDPRRDLVPVCPNCHAMLHTSDPPLEIEKLRPKSGRVANAISPLEEFAALQ